MKLKNIYLSCLVAGTLVACSEGDMDYINRNVNDPSDVPARFLFTDAVTASAFNVTASDFAFYASVYMEHNVGIFNQLYNAEIRNNEPYASSTYNNKWNGTYENLRVLKIVREKCAPNGQESGANHLLGMAQILTAYNLAILTDLMGDIPWKEALQPGVIYQPRMDKQETIYADVFRFLDEGLTNLDKPDDPTLLPVGRQDLVYGTLDSTRQLALWKKTAYGLKARYLMRLSHITPDYDGVIAMANQSFASASEQFQFKYDGVSTVNPFQAFFDSRKYFGASKSLNDKLVYRSDPRKAKFFKAYPGTSNLIFAENGNPEQRQRYYGISGIMSGTMPTQMLSYHELQFLIAEAYARKSNPGLAEPALIKAIKAAFVKVGLSESDAQTYYDAQVKSLFDANPLSEIMNQKYLAFYEDEAVEAYNDYRRWKAMGDNAVILANPKPFPLRFTYGSSDVVSNPYVRDAYGNGQYVNTEDVWWAGGSR